MMSRNNQFHVSSARIPCTSVVSTRCPHPLCSRQTTRRAHRVRRKLRGAERAVRGRHVRRPRTVAQAGEHVEAAEFREHHLFVGLELRPRAVATEPRHRHVHEARVLGADRVVVDAEPFRDAGPPRLDHDVGGRREVARGLHVDRVREVERDAALAARPERPRGLGARRTVAQAVRPSPRHNRSRRASATRARRSSSWRGRRPAGRRAGRPSATTRCADGPEHRQRDVVVDAVKNTTVTGRSTVSCSRSTSRTHVSRRTGSGPSCRRAPRPRRCTHRGRRAAG